MAGILRWFRNRGGDGEVRRVIKETDLRAVAHVLTKVFKGSILPNKLVGVLDNFVHNPCEETALELADFDGELAAYVFLLARKGGPVSRGISSGKDPMTFVPTHYPGPEEMAQALSDSESADGLARIKERYGSSDEPGRGMSNGHDP